MADQRIPMTREGYEKLKAELDRMQNVEMIEVAKRIGAAREMGDLNENAEYHAAREDQGMLQARIRQLEDELARAIEVDAVKKMQGGYQGRAVDEAAPQRRQSQCHRCAHAAEGPNQP